MPGISVLERFARRDQEHAADETRWNARPLVALSLRAVMAGVPAAASVLVALFIEAVTPPPTTWPARIVTWALVLGVCTIVALLVERRMRSLLPLALLMRMTLVFPDVAPSRYAVARAANGPAKIKQLAAAGESPRAQAAAQVLALVTRLAKHDRHTRGHSERVRVFTDLIAEQMGVSGSDRDKLAWGALLHDIGKMTVPGELLNKPGKPSPQEWDVLKKHPLAGENFAGPLVEWLGPWVGGITEHHERFDGKGYPRALAAQDITLAGRIVAVADAYETMTAARSYKKPMSVAAARQELTDCAGAHFDPVVVRAFLAVSLPRLMWGVGPLSFLAHLPFVARAEVLSVQLAAASTAAAPAAAAAAVGAASVVTAGAVAPAPAAHTPQPAHVTVADTVKDSGTSVGWTGQQSGSRAGEEARLSPTDVPKPTGIPRSDRASNSRVAGSPTPTAPTHAGSAHPSPGAKGEGNPGKAKGTSKEDGNGNSGKADPPPSGTGSGSSSSTNSGKGSGSSSSSNSGKGDAGQKSTLPATAPAPVPSTPKTGTASASANTSNSGTTNSGKSKPAKGKG